MDTRKKGQNEYGQTLEEVIPRDSGCGISLTGDIQNLTGDGLGKPNVILELAAVCTRC